MKSALNHIAIIMDGNGRWANSRFRPREWGHVRGANVVSEIIEEADANSIKALTLYCFSTENWKRPDHEVSALFKLLKKFILKEKKRIIRENIRFRVIGTIEGLPRDTQELILELEEITKDANGLKLNFAFNYGSKDEIIRAINSYIASNPGQSLSEEVVSSLLDTTDVGDVDLLIRTGGDFRLSNFLLWQSAYAELHFTETKWPDFGKKEFRRIIDTYYGRERRFGGVLASAN